MSWTIGGPPPTAPRPARRSAPALAPLDAARTRRALNGRTKRWEQIEAVTADGAYLFRRGDDEKTTWTTTHVPTDRSIQGTSSLRQCRIDVASGWAAAEIDRQYADLAARHPELRR